jgi:hypothetical protein
MGVVIFNFRCELEFEIYYPYLPVLTFYVHLHPSSVHPIADAQQPTATKTKSTVKPNRKGWCLLLLLPVDS